MGGTSKEAKIRLFNRFETLSNFDLFTANKIIYSFEIITSQNQHYVAERFRRVWCCDSDMEGYSEVAINQPSSPDPFSQPWDEGGKVIKINK